MSSEEHLQETDTEARFEFKKEESSAFQTEKGLTEETIRIISEDKDEPEWMLNRRLRALEQFREKRPLRRRRPVRIRNRLPEYAGTLGGQRRRLL